jgi:methylglyoxal reductase
MQTTPFANTNIPISRVAFGAMGLNCAFGCFEEKDLIRSIHHSLDQGVTMFDTARSYMDSERILGKAIKEWSGAKPFINSKAIPSEANGNPGWGMPNPVDVAYPKGSIRQSVEESLRQLGVDTIDLMQLHQYWGNFLGAGTWMEELQVLQAEGKIQHIGVSIVDHRHETALEIVNSGFISSVQTIINIFDPLALDSLVPACQKNNVAVIARCVLDEGGLTGMLKDDTTFEEGDFREKYFINGPQAEYVARVEKLKQYVPEHADSLAELAIRFVLTHPGVTTACISMHVPKFADENIKAAAKGPLPEAVFHEIRCHHRWLHNLYTGFYFPDAVDAGAKTGVGGFKEMKKRSLDDV